MSELRPLLDPQQKPAGAAGAYPDWKTQCWASIGTHGDNTCRELKVHLHCRNCPVFGKVGSELLNRPLPADYRQEWAGYFDEARTQKNFTTISAVPFRIGTQWLAFPTNCVQEIAEKRAIHSLPQVQTMVLGVANIRGEILLCVSLGHVLGVSGLPGQRSLRSDHSRLLVVSRQEDRIAFPVDEVHGPERFPPQQVQPAPHPAGRGTSYTDRLLHWKQQRVALLDPHLVLSQVDRFLA